MDPRKIAYAIAAIGLLVSIYLASVQLAGAPLVCPASGVINCENVLFSSYSKILGVPASVFGIVFFIAEILAIKAYFGKDQLIMLNIVGIGFVIYYLYSEYMIGSICIYCTAVHICTLALLALSIKCYRKE